MTPFEEYIKNYNYKSIPAMKINSEQLIEMLPEGNVQVIDIRFKEEYEMWHSGIAKNIPINELPDRLDELDAEKLIVTVCPHNLRSNIAMHYLKTKGFNVKFLTDGLTTLNSQLLGGGARKLHNALN
jgi:rhodanese-related sulfurtransferase